MEVILYTILAAVIGMVVGSFINVVVFRTKSGESWMKGRSKCRTCLEPVAAVDLVPVVSFFRLKGRCRHCSSVIEWQYPAVEMVMGILFGLLYARVALQVGIPAFVDDAELFALFVRDAVIAVFLVIIFVYDFRYSYILDRFTIPAMLVALLFNVLLGADVVSLLLGGLLIGGFFAIQFLVSDGKWIGGGDIRLGMLMGFLLGAQVGVVALFLSYVLGAAVGMYLVIAKKRALNSHVPFGTFLALGTLISMIWGQQLLAWYLSFF